MTLNDEFEARLRADLLANELDVTPGSNLAPSAIAAGRRSLNRRRLAAGAGGVLAVTTLVLVGVALRDGSPDSRTPVPPGASHKPPTSSEATGSPMDWASSLPLGEAPEVPYLVGVDLHLPSGQVIDLDGSGAGIVGASNVGTVLLVETEDSNGTPFSSRYVVVSDDGVVTELPISTRTPVQEAAISPDEELMAAHTSVTKLQDLSAVAAMPEDAELLVAWTNSGIVYHAHRDGYFLWQPGGQEPPIKLDGHPGVFLNGTDIGLRGRHGCSQVVQLQPDGTINPRYEICEGQRLHTVSPAGNWAITLDLELVDVRTGTVAPLDHANVGRIHVGADTRWLSENEVLLTITSPEGEGPVSRAVLVRCRLTDNVCERATDALDVPLTQGNIGLP